MYKARRTGIEVLGNSGLARHVLGNLRHPQSIESCRGNRLRYQLEDRLIERKTAPLVIFATLSQPDRTRLDVAVATTSTVG